MANLVGKLVDSHEIYWLCLADPDTDAVSLPIRGLAEPPRLVRTRANLRWRDKVSDALRPVHWERTASRALGLLGGLPLDVVRMRTPDLKRALKDLLTTRRIDVVQIEYGAMAGYLPVIRRASPETKVVVDELEVTSIAIDRRMKSESRSPRRMRWQANCWKRFERKTWKASDAVLAMSESEGAYIARAAGPGKARIVPNGVDIDFFRFRSADATVTPGPSRLLFVGNLQHRPNAQGIEVFLRTSWPTLAETFPELELHVVGPGASEELRARRGQRVIFHGHVDDVRPHFAAEHASKCWKLWPRERRSYRRAWDAKACQLLTGEKLSWQTRHLIFKTTWQHCCGNPSGALRWLRLAGAWSRSAIVGRLYAATLKRFGSAYRPPKTVFRSSSGRETSSL